MKRIIIISFVFLAIVGFSSDTVFSISSAVYQAQKALKALAYDPGPIDGLWGNATKRAINRFQQNSRLPVTGRLDEGTKDKLGITPDKDSLPVIGVWKEKIGTSVRTITIQKQNDRVVMITKYGDFSGRKSEMFESRKSDNSVYKQKGDNPDGVYFIVKHSGNLEIYDRLGFIATAMRIR